MSTPQKVPSQVGSKEDPISILGHDISHPEASRQMSSTETESENTHESHENAALLVLPPLTFTRRPLYTMDTSEQEPKLHWSHELYWSIPACKSVTITYCRTRKESEDAARRLWGRERLLGFDMEWKPQYQKKQADQTPRPLTGREIKENASLIQLACESEIVIFHIAAHAGNSREQLVAPSLRKLLESPAVTKTGVAIMNADAARLRKYLGINPRGLFELSHLYKVIEHGAGHDPGPEASKTGVTHVGGFKKLVALKTQVEEHLGLPLSKGKVRTSNWSRAVDLTPTQIKYAADDAYAGYMLFRVMDDKRRSMVPRPPIPAHAEQKLPIKRAATVPKAAATDVEKLSATDKENDPLLPVQSKAQTTKTLVEEENDADEADFEESKDANTFKKPRIYQAGAQPHVLTSVTAPAGKPVMLQQQQQQQQQHPIPERSVDKSLLQEPVLLSVSSSPVSEKLETTPSDERVYDSTDRTMRQVFSALNGLSIQLANKRGMKAEEIASEHVLQYLAASRPASAKHIRDDLMIQCRRLIDFCELVGKDLFEFLKRYTPLMETPSEQFSAIRARTAGRSSEDVANGIHRRQSDGKGKRPLSASLRDLTLQPTDQGARDMSLEH